MTTVIILILQRYFNTTLLSDPNGAGDDITRQKQNLSNENPILLIDAMNCKHRM